MKCDERIRYNGSDIGGGICGWCRGHTKFDMNITSYEDVLMWEECLGKVEVHVAREITCVAFGALREAGHSVKVIFASGTCKKDESGEHTNWMIRSLLKLWGDDLRGRAARGPNFANQADAASHFVLEAHGCSRSSAPDTGARLGAVQCSDQAAIVHYDCGFRQSQKHNLSELASTESTVQSRSATS